MSARPFDVVPHDHALQATAALLRAAIAERFPSGAHERSIVHAELKIGQADGAWRAERGYWSHQLHDPTRPFGLRADTLIWSAKNPEPEWLSFPDDPYLSSAAAVLRDWADAGVEGRVLRYVPLRRLTLRVRHPVHGPAIAKFKRRSRAAEGHALIGRVASVFDGARLPIRVSRSIAFDPDLSLYFQSLLDGEDVAERLTPRRHDLFGTMGQLHAAMHALPGSGFSIVGNERWLSQAENDLALLQCLRPIDAERLAGFDALLRRRLPVPARAAFCHGDLVASQFLVAGADWSLTDFDLCHAGDPLRDVAIFLASLSYDVPAFHGDHAAALAGIDGRGLTQAYLDGYRGAGGADLTPLPWHRVCAGLYYLALMLKKDRVEEVAFKTLLDETCRQANALDSRDQAR